MTVGFGCGRVIQETAVPEPAIKSFDLTYSWQPTQDLKTMFVYVLGLKKEKSEIQLSWGSSILKAGKSGGAILENRNKQGLRLTTSDHTESIFSYQPSPNFRWTGNSNKVKSGFDAYLVSVFSSPDIYRFKLIESDVIAGKKSFYLGEVTDYDTFLAILYMTDFRTKKTSGVLSTRMIELELLYSKEFFSALNYSIPKNSAEKFNPRNPNFEFNRPLENELVYIYKLSKTDRKKAVEKLNELSNLVLPKKAKGSLIHSLSKSR